MDALLGMAELTEALVREVVGRGIVGRSADNYRYACNVLASHAREEGFDAWCDGLGDRLLAWVAGLRSSGDLSASYARFLCRVARALDSLAETGEADLSRARGGARAYPVDPATAAVVEEILDDGRLPESVRAGLGTVVRHLLWYAAERGAGPLEIDDSLVMDFLLSEVPRTNPRSSTLAMRAVRLATSWMRRNGGRVARDYSRLRVRREGSRVIPAFTEAEVAAILGAFDPATAAGGRNRAFVMVAYCTGLRMSDVISLRLRDIDWRRSSLTTCQSKTHSPITCALNGETMNAVADYVLHLRPECDRPEVFVTLRAPHGRLSPGTVESWFGEACERAGVEKLAWRSFHSLRRAFETVAVSRGVPIETVSQMVGHASVAADKPYVTCGRDAVSSVPSGFGEVPVLHGAYATSAEGGGGA